MAITKSNGVPPNELKVGVMVFRGEWCKRNENKYGRYHGFICIENFKYILVNVLWKTSKFIISNLLGIKSQKTMKS